MSIYLRVLFVIVLALPVAGRQTSAGPGKRAANRSVTAASKPRGLTVDGVVSMVEAGLSDDVIIARLRKEAKALDLSPDEMIRLKKAKVSDAVMK